MWLQLAENMTMTTTTKKTNTNTSGKFGTRCAAMMTAALALPAVSIAHADLAPERAQISLKYLDYQDAQPGTDRIRVRAPALSLLLPIAGDWALSSTYTTDSISGASPAYHTSAITKMQDLRRAIDLKLTKYLPRGTVTVGTSYSNESDYVSRGFSISGTVSSEDKNTTFNAGIGVTNDEINPNNHVVVGETKHVTDWIVGVTQVLTPNDIAQVNFGYSAGAGYFTDPYKAFDQRPGSRDHSTVMLRWNHHFNETNGSSHLSYRYYSDTYGIKAHTFTAEYVQPFSSGWTVTPLFRYYTQSAADFYVEVDPAAGGFATLPDFTKPYYSEDQRLADYGAITAGFKVTKEINPDWLIDFKFEKYEQKAALAANSGGSYGLDTFRFTSYQFGLTHKF